MATTTVQPSKIVKNFVPSPMTNAQANKNLVNHSLGNKIQLDIGKTKDVSKTTKAITGTLGSAVSSTTPSQPQYKAPDPFSFNYNYLTYDNARGQAEQQFNPLFEQAVAGVKAQQYQNNLDSGQSSAVRGLAHSGLAQDALTKIAIASQGQISGLNAQKMSDVARMAQQLVERDQDRGDRQRAQAFAEYDSNRNFGRNNFESDRNYDLTKSDQDFNHMNANRYYDLDVDKNNFTKMDSNRNFKLNESGITGTYNGQQTYQAKQDSIHNAQTDRQLSQTDAQIKQEAYEFEKTYGLDMKKFMYDMKVTDRQWYQMSPAQKQQMALEYKYSMSLKKASGSPGGGKRKSTSTKDKKTTVSNPNTQGPKLPGKTPTVAPQTYDAYAKKMASIMEPEEYKAYLVEQEKKRREEIAKSKKKK